MDTYKSVPLISFISFLLQYVFRYRTKVVLQNWSFVHLALDLRLYYLYFSANFISIVKSFFVSREQIISLVSYKNLDRVQNAMNSGRRVLVMATHCSNWEWVGLNLSCVLKGDCIAVYKPLSQKYLDHFVRSKRSRTGMKLAAMSEVIRYVHKYPSGSCFLFIADQSPALHQKGINVHFLGRDTFFYEGPQKLAVKYDFDVFYQSVKESDGKYIVEFFEIEDKSKLMEIYASHLEKDILNNPYHWLWTHRRWKKQRLYQ